MSTFFWVDLCREKVEFQQADASIAIDVHFLEHVAGKQAMHNNKRLAGRWRRDSIRRPVMHKDCYFYKHTMTVHACSLMRCIRTYIRM